MSDWMTFREVGSDKLAKARQLKDGSWKVKRGLIARKLSASEFEKKYEAR